MGVGVCILLRITRASALEDMTFNNEGNHPMTDQTSGPAPDSIVVTITPSAEEYLQELLAKQDTPDIAVRVFVEKPGTPMAECCMSYCAPGEEKEGDHFQTHDGFNAWIEGDSLPYLEDAVIDFMKDRLGGQLTFRAPKSKVPRASDDSSVEERIQYVLYAEVNPGLASHGGNVALERLEDDDTTAILRFGGGCQGCGMASVTLKEGVEKTLLERIPELKKVVDVTDHSQKENAYYL